MSLWALSSEVPGRSQVPGTEVGDRTNGWPISYIMEPGSAGAGGRHGDSFVHDEASDGAGTPIANRDHRRLRSVHLVQPRRGRQAGPGPTGGTAWVRPDLVPTT